MKTRKLITGKRVKELEVPVKWEFESRCPAKWVHVDCESGQVYVINSDRKNSWTDPTENQVEAAFQVLKKCKKDADKNKV